MVSRIVSYVMIWLSAPHTYRYYKSNCEGTALEANNLGEDYMRCLQLALLVYGPLYHV